MGKRDACPAGDSSARRVRTQGRRAAGATTRRRLVVRSRRYSKKYRKPMYTGIKNSVLFAKIT